MSEPKRTLPLQIPPLLAVQFLTRLPVSFAIPALDTAQLQAGLRRSVGWFPLVGGLVGAIDALVLVAGEALWPRFVAVALMLIVEARLTGAFHEDAVADFCDGMGGGHSPERIRDIMKDSRIGTYGALGLMLALGLRAGLLLAMPPALLVPAVVASAALGRWLAVLAMAAIVPVEQGGSLAKDIGQRPAVATVIFATLSALALAVPFGLHDPARLGLAIGLCGLLLWWLRGLLLRRLGGVSGDCLGFAVYAAQLVVLLCALAAWKS